MKTLQILVADDHELFRHGLRTVLESQSGWKICGEAVNGRQAVELAGQMAPDVVILDISMPELNGLEAARLIRKAAPRAEILILTMHESEQLVNDVLAAGAHGYILKTDTARLLVTAIETLAQHKPFFTGKVSDLVLQGYLKPGAAPADESVSRSRLTAREREIVQLLAEGKTNKDAAVAMGISIKTVDAHRTNIMRKLNLHSVAELVRYAVRNKIIEP